MKKGRDLWNKPVIDVNSGKQLGYVCDIEFDEEDERKIAGVYSGSKTEVSYYIPLQSISSMGRDAVLVSGWVAVSPGTLKHQIKKRYSGTQVMTSLGQNIGTVEDIVIEEKEGSIMGYEVSDGLIKDMVLGRKIISTEDILTYGEENIIVADSKT